MKRIYLDYAATTPVDPRVSKTMEPFLSENFGNTMSLHSFGQEAKIVLEESREKLAGVINANPNEIIFTSSATESNNLALKGSALASKKGHIIISSIEHHCVVESAKWLAKNGFEITEISVDKFGKVNPEDIKKAITEKTILVSVIHASNEIGTIQPITEIGKICKEKNVLFHTDASQSFGKILIDVKKMNIDLLTASSHKIYGPKGAGLLYIREGINIAPLLHGGGQENGLRSSTVNVGAIAGFAAAAEIYKKEGKKENQKLIKLRDKLIKELLKIKGSHLNGDPKKRLPNNVNVRFDFVEGESLVIQLDMHGIACSTGSACSSATLEPSHVLLATGLKPEQAHGSLRITLGRWTTEKDINYLLKVLPKIVKKIREISPFK
ncbi:MAG: cysteine desulfurase NifS [Candidatus Staskawiczbacteria bacterium RIFOXYD2_FULL_37_9]|uniref:cysteine desulfurase n=1 Tax=Candidatus Staskawiczbacteria bacterium RIFOXYB1_FULL_37_44 TaxID=1802223 RepID=A0A1G2IY62_9BACT|nr:MAG: cysteine desulfurase NifS [Candidatus Staskawiczbacteria bacterium RIFOXYB1_FULL_37_44]OGZ83402.1 MAG: cysteine desulfurase NifS [Candidatus Staskawiczbacteria bacterium RIFOXYC1_FULL_37_52]OGZ88243.1 MAG: cysteine desulfurase NifS [Candidatus Staskawiczbacteria bacterium RIFOXYC2_FULL_37_19]OGZ88805.1 MAG: cysteine desulfurase NifS [Candidatus Staskawiczbacteria bacterium RIFOXYD1_FULL_37_110]OGZ94873.1 MAG: cysteine desulfurase NifS [Candidatus Staskawiczbacteria bacterium RIFOXYD2_FU